MMKHQRPRAPVLALIAMAPLTACVDTLPLGRDAGEGTGGSDGGVEENGVTTSAATTSGTGPAGQPTASVRRISTEARAEFCESMEPCDLPDGTLFLLIDSSEAACGFPMNLDAQWVTGRWRVGYVLVPEVQEVGLFPDADEAHLVYGWGNNAGGGRSRSSRSTACSSRFASTSRENTSG
jgi:hypothetical protein